MRGMNDELVELATNLFREMPEAQHRTLLAMLERLAAEQYRRWAEEVGGKHASGLLECAAREEQVAQLLEDESTDSDEIASAVAARAPELRAGYAALFQGRSLVEQFAIQAQGERAGGVLLRSYDKSDAAELEDHNARYLDEMSRSLND
jgi:hypothetical protein